MPIYEYRCDDCDRKVTLLLSVSAKETAGGEKCPSCGSSKLAKLVSKFRRGRSEDARIDEVSDRLETMGEPESPTEMRELVREMGKAMDDDYGDEMEEMFEGDQDNPDTAEDI